MQHQIHPNTNEFISKQERERKKERKNERKKEEERRKKKEEERQKETMNEWMNVPTMYMATFFLMKNLISSLKH